MRENADPHNLINDLMQRNSGNPRGPIALREALHSTHHLAVAG